MPPEDPELDRKRREMTQELNRRLNKVVDEIAEEKGISREEILKFARKFLSQMK